MEGGEVGGRTMEGEKRRRKWIGETKLEFRP